MSGYLLDTDICVEIMRGRNCEVLQRLAAAARKDVAISVVTAAELLFGAWRSHNSARNLEVCREFCGSFEVLPLTMPAAELSGELRAALETAGQRIGSYDILIAGAALAEERILVTHNTREFGRIPNLRVEDWLATG